jgi:hypothetical protein
VIVSNYVADEVRMTHAGMMIAILPEQWVPLRQLAHDDFCGLLLHIAANVKTTALRKSVRGPKKRVKKKRISPSIAGAHVSTARLLAKARQGTTS